MRRGWAPLSSSSAPLSSSLLWRGGCSHVPPCLTSLSCLTASPAAMDTAYRESSWLPPLSFPITPHASLAPSFAASPDNAGRKDPLLRFFATHKDSRRRIPATPTHLEDVETILSVSLSSFFWIFNRVFFVLFVLCVVFIFHFTLEQLSPMSRFGHYCRHVPGIGCNWQWKQPQPHHRPRWGAGEPPQGGED